jgi:signal transduction histidine kinase
MKSISEKDDFYAGLLHEVKNNLAILSSRLQLLANEYPFLHKDEIFIQLSDDIKSTYQIVNNYKSDFQLPQLLPCNVRLLLLHLYEMCLPMFQQNNKTLTIDVPDYLPVIRADAYQLHQAFLNLIKNASEATAPGQWVHIQANICSDFISITISDNGIGMTPEQVKHIFDAHISYKPNGTGFGLYMVKKTVYAHHGRIECHSEYQNGSVFRILLPLPSSPV